MPPSKQKSPHTRPHPKGFTLVELIVAMSLSLLVLGGAVSAFIFLARSSLRLSQYNVMEGESRTLLQQFNQDVRQAENAAWTDVNTLDLSVSGKQIRYRYDPDANAFSRTPQGGPTIVLANNLSAFAFRAFQVTGSELPLQSSPASVGPATKMIQVNIELRRGNSSTGSVTGQLISARSILRNKKI